MEAKDTKIIIGLTIEEVEERKRKNLVNYDTSVPTKSIKRILLENFFTLFNFLKLYNKKTSIRKFNNLMVTRTGFEPINARVKGVCVNRFTNGPYFNGGPEWT